MEKFSLVGAVATAGSGEILATQITGNEPMDLILKIVLPIITGVIVPKLGPLLDAIIYRIRNGNKNKQLKTKNDANKESEN